MNDESSKEQLSLNDILSEIPPVTADEAVVELCPHCGAKMKAYWHKLTPLLVRTLVKFRVGVNEKGMNKVHLQDDLDLTKTEYNNFQKLRLHGLVAKYKEEGQHINGYWLLTRRGSDFLNGTLDIPKRVKTFRNKVVDYDPVKVFVVDVINEQPFVETIDDIQYDIVQSN